MADALRALPQNKGTMLVSAKKGKRPAADLEAGPSERAQERQREAAQDGVERGAKRQALGTGRTSPAAAATATAASDGPYSLSMAVVGRPHGMPHAPLHAPPAAGAFGYLVTAPAATAAGPSAELQPPPGAPLPMLRDRVKWQRSMPGRQTGVGSIRMPQLSGKATAR